MNELRKLVWMIEDQLKTTASESYMNSLMAHAIIEIEKRLETLESSDRINHTRLK
jgi:hypothetical protein